MQPLPWSQKSSRPLLRPCGKPGGIPAAPTQQVILEEKLGTDRRWVGAEASQRALTPVMAWFAKDFLLATDLQLQFFSEKFRFVSLADATAFTFDVHCHMRSFAFFFST